jgi:hypothetical protein
MGAVQGDGGDPRCRSDHGWVLALSNWIGHAPQTINVHLDAPIVLQPK